MSRAQLIETLLDLTTGFCIVRPALYAAKESTSQISMSDLENAITAFHAGRSFPELFML